MVASPSVSVVMSVYNGAENLPETLESILGQEGVDLEFIVVNDGSTDDTLKILDQYAVKDNRLKVLNQENQGLTRSLIRGCAEAKGEYIARQDVGDMSLPTRLVKQQDLLLAEKELAFVSCWTKYVGPKREFLFLKKGSGVSKNAVVILSDLEEWGVIDGPSHHGSVMFRRAAYQKIGGYREEFYYGQDWDLWYRLGAVGSFQMLQEVFYIAEVTVDSISTTAKIAQNEIAKLSRKALHARLCCENDAGFIEKVSKIRSKYITNNRKSSASKSSGYYFIGECLRMNKDSRASQYFKDAITCNLLYWRAWVRLIQNNLKLYFFRK